jgi:hypothetical protein
MRTCGNVRARNEGFAYKHERIAVPSVSYERKY